MMFLLFQNVDLETIDLVLVSIPESVGILAVGVGLIGAAVFVRWLLAGESSK